MTERRQHSLDQLQFLRQSARLEESDTPYLVRRTTTVLSLLVLLFIGWAIVTPVEEIAQAPGEVVPNGFSQTIQHYEGGIVKNIPVHEGSVVKKSDPLLELDGAGAQEELNKALVVKNGLLRDIEVAKEMFDIQQELKDKQVSSKTRYLESKEKLNQVLNALEQQEIVITRLKNRVARLEVRSPADGIVKDLKVNTVGAVIKSGETLMEIVPTEQKLVVEAHVSPRDIGHVSIGQPVKVKVSSYEYGRYGAISGKLDFITATTFTDTRGEKYYRARILLSDGHVGKQATMKILPGMTVQAGIITGKKSVMAYLLKPVQRAMQDSLSER